MSGLLLIEPGGSTSSDGRGYSSDHPDPDPSTRHNIGNMKTDSAEPLPPPNFQRQPLSRCGRSEGSTDDMDENDL